MSLWRRWRISYLYYEKRPQFHTLTRAQLDCTAPLWVLLQTLCLNYIVHNIQTGIKLIEFSGMQLII